MRSKFETDTPTRRIPFSVGSRLRMRTRVISQNRDCDAIGVVTLRLLLKIGVFDFDGDGTAKGCCLFAPFPDFVSLAEDFAFDGGRIG